MTGRGDPGSKANGKYITQDSFDRGSRCVCVCVVVEHVFNFTKRNKGKGKKEKKERVDSGQGSK